MLERKDRVSHSTYVARMPEFNQSKYILEDTRGQVDIFDSNAWVGNWRHLENTMHQLSPYIGKMKSVMARQLISRFTKPGEVVLDPFCGSGTVPLECIIAERPVVCCDTNPYAIILTLAKLHAPPTLDEALDRSKRYLMHLNSQARQVDLTLVPEWVKSFFHNRTLQEVIALMSEFKMNQEYFLMACLLGILHHQRPGFLSYPSSHLVPYLRTKKFPSETYPELYGYRDVASRLEGKIKRVNRRLPHINKDIKGICTQCDAARLDIPDSSIDAIITSPPYMNTLDYGRDNRLRLWLLDVNDYAKVDRQMPKNGEQFECMMTACFKNFHRILKNGAMCVLVLGELQIRDIRTNTAQIVVDITTQRIGGFNCEGVVRDIIPDMLRARRGCTRTKYEWIVILRKDRSHG